MTRLWTWLLIGSIMMVGGGCATQYDPNVYPTLLARVDQTIPFRPVDLDGDARDELVRIGQMQAGEAQSVFIRTLAGRAIAQVPFPGPVISLETLDVTQNGRLELVAAVVQNDSLFYNVLSAGGEKLGRFFAVAGTPRQEPGGTIAWDLRNVDIRVADVTGDGAPELASFYKTGFARQPRGVWVHTYPEGRLVGKQPIGALGRTEYFGDVDDDTRPEWLFGSLATNNGGQAAGMSDATAYLGSIQVSESPGIEWARDMGETFSEVSLQAGDLDGEGDVEFVALRKPREGRQTKSPLYRINPTTGRSLRRYVPDNIIRSIRVGTLGKEGRDRIVVRDVRGTLRVLDGELNVLHHRSFEREVQSVQLLPDVDGDGREEIFVRTDRGTLWLGPDLSSRLATRQGGHWRVIQTGVGESPRVAMISENGRMTHFRVQENTWWWAYRYGPGAGILLCAVAVVAGGIAGVRRYRQFRLRESVHERVAAHSDRAWVLAHPHHGLRWASAGVPRLLGETDPEALNLDLLRERAPALADCLDALGREPARLPVDEVTINEQVLSVSASPLEVSRQGRPYWLLWLEPKTQDEETYRAQGLMAQRVAHDLKNPLTSIRLTLQRMQMLYREQAPTLADTLDEYTDHLEERIESLRRMTTNVLKFVDKEDLRRTPTDLSAFLDDLIEILAQDLPPDIQLETKFTSDLPSAAVDQVQLRSVVENLVTNAVEAMPEGGRLTLSTRLARDLSFDGDPAACDYAVVEVLDTGVGMTAKERARLFEPGFSTRDDTGLGMAIVRKVVDDHGGHVEVESEPGVGTSIALYLPLRPTD